MEAETQQLVFLYGSHKLSSTKIADALLLKRQEWIANNDFSEKEGREVFNAIGELASRIESGDVDRMDYLGHIHSNSDFTNNPINKTFLGIKVGTGVGGKFGPNGVAGAMLDEMMQLAINNSNETTSTTEAYNTALWKEAFSNKFYGGQFTGSIPLITHFLDKDPKGEDGTRPLTNRISEMATFLEEYANTLPSDKDYSKLGGSKDAYKLRILDAASALKGGDLSQLVGLGMSPEDIQILFSTEEATTREGEVNLRTAALNKKIQEWRLLGIPEDKINEYISFYNLQDVVDPYMELQLASKKWNEYADLAYDRNFKGTTYNLANGIPWDENEIAFYEGRRVDGKYTEGKIQKTGKSFFAPYLNALNNWNPSSWDKNLTRRIRASLHYAIKINPEKFGKIPNTAHTYYIRPLTNWNNGTAWTFDFATDTLKLVNVYTDPVLRELALKRWLKLNLPNYQLLQELILQLLALLAALAQVLAEQSNPLQELEGATVSLKNGGILKAQDGTQLLNYINNKHQKEIDTWYQLEATATGRSVDLVKEGQKTFSKDGSFEFNLRPSDYWHLASLAQDVASIPISYGGHVGIGAAGALGLTSMATDIVADIQDPSVSKEEVWKNAGVGLGLAAVGMIPGGAGKIGRIWTKVRRYLPLILSGAAAFGLANDPRVLKTVRKLTDNQHNDENPDLTYDDWVNIGHIIKTIAIGHNSARGIVRENHLRETSNTPGKGYTTANSDNDYVTIKVGGKDSKILKGDYNKIEAAYREHASTQEGTGRSGAQTEFERIVNGMADGEIKQGLVDGEGNPLKLSFKEGFSDSNKASKIPFRSKKPTELSELLSLKEPEAVVTKPEMASSINLKTWDGLGPKGRAYYELYYKNGKTNILDYIFNNDYEIANGKGIFSFGTPIAKLRLSTKPVISALEAPIEPGVGPKSNANAEVIPEEPKADIPGKQESGAGKQESGAGSGEQKAAENTSEGAENNSGGKAENTSGEQANAEAEKPNAGSGEGSKEATTENNIAGETPNTEGNSVDGPGAHNSEATIGGNGGSGVEGAQEKADNLGNALEGKVDPKKAAIKYIEERIKNDVPEDANPTFVARTRFVKGTRKINKAREDLKSLRKLLRADKENKDLLKQVDDLSRLVRSYKRTVKRIESQKNVSKAKFDALFGLRNGGNIPTFLSGGGLSYEDYLNIYDPNGLGAGYSSLAGWNNGLRLNYADDYIKENGHYLAGDLQEAFRKNLAYTSNQDVVGKDINYYYNTAHSDITDLQKFVDTYNTDAEKIRKHWESLLSYDNTSGREHNPLFRILFNSRSLNNNNNIPYNIGYLSNIQDRLGSSTWLRRMDRYKGEWASLSDEEKLKRIHKVGNLGWVYKENNGNIGIVSEEELARLQGNNPKQPKESVVETPAGDPVDPTDAWLSIANLGKGKGKSKKEYLSKLRTLGINPWPLARFADAAATNKRILKLGNKEKTALLQFTPFTDNVRGDLGSLMNYLLAANSTRSNAHKTAKNTSDIQASYAIEAEGNKNARLQEIQGRNIDNTTIELSTQRVNLYAYNNVKGYDAVANENRAKLAALYNSKLANKMQYENVQNANRAQLMSEWDYEYKKRKADRKTLATQALTYEYNRRKKTYLQSAAEDVLAARQSGDANAFNKAVLAYRAAAKEFEDKYSDAYNKQLFKIHGYNMDSFEDPFSIIDDARKASYSIFSDVDLNLKNGGKISDDGPKRARAKDDAEFGKRNRSVNKATIRSLELIGKLKELYVKRYLK